MPALIVLLLAAAAALVVAAHWKSAYRDARSVQTYHTTLEHLQHMAGGSAAAAETHVKVLPGAQLRFQQLSPAGGGKRKPGATLPMVSPPAGGRKLMFVDESVAGAAVPGAAETRSAAARKNLGPAAAPETAPAPAVGALPGARRRRLPAVPSLRSPALRMVAVAAASALVAVIATMAFRSGGGAPVHQAASPKIPAAVHAPKAATARHPVQVPAQPVPLASGSTAYSAAYEVGSGPVDLGLVAVQRCWVELRTGSTTGPIVFEGLLAPGDRKSFGALPGLWLRIGNPAGLNVVVDGTAIPLPPTATPYEVTVESATAPSTG
ncbi:MAG TPA: DUF4115 domain-containing protein [Acidimicrobiales bacterium]|nr:DUF4115 domain-containing protein [Acidimicrobiales bacterium]